MPCTKYFATGTVSLSFHYPRNNHFQMRKLRFREVKQLAQCRAAS